MPLSKPFHRPRSPAARGRALKRRLAPWLFLAPSLLCVSVFVLLPFLDAVRRSFFSAMSGRFTGLSNYAAVLRNEAFLVAAKNTLLFTIFCIPMLVVLSLLLALALNALREKRGVFKTTFLIPMAVPVASIVLLWRAFFHENGLLNSMLVRCGAEPVDWMNSGWAMLLLVCSYLWKNTGYDMILWLSGISSLPLSLFEAAAVDGCGPAARFFRVTLPNLRPSLFTVSVLSLLNSFKVFREAYLISGAYPDKSIYLLQHLFNNWFLTLDVDKMCAAAVLLALCVFGLILLMQALWGREV